jgi:hypothetical protein
MLPGLRHRIERSNGFLVADADHAIRGRLSWAVSYAFPERLRRSASSPAGRRVIGGSPDRLRFGDSLGALSARIAMIAIGLRLDYRTC